MPFLSLFFQTDSAELSTGSELSSYYYLNGFQLQCDVPPKVNKIGQLKITLNQGVEGDREEIQHLNNIDSLALR